VPIDVVLRDENGREVRALSDPAGGTFDAAGDFDRLLYIDASLRAWSRVDPDGSVVSSGDECSELLAELPTLLALSKPGRERRGLERLRVLAEQVVATPGATLLVRGD
jgi:hypothetical protein